MKVKDYLFDKFYVILTSTIITVLLVLFLRWINISNSVIFLVVLSIFSIVFIFLFTEFWRRYNYYNEIMNTLDELDKKYLLFDMIEKRYFIDARLIQDIIRLANLSMNEEVSKYRLSQEEYKEYIELWVHEIKTPLSALKLMLENNGLKESVKELERVNYYVDQALFYARSSNVDKDYLISKVNLKESLLTVIRQLKNNFIEQDINIDFDVVDTFVYSDNKWLEFIIKQILINSIQYSVKHGEINIKVVENESNVKLSIADNGIGIKETDLPRIFDLGYTGSSGRIYNQATGMGLYLVKQLSNALYIDIEAVSDELTIFTLTIPKSNTYFKD